MNKSELKRNDPTQPQESPCPPGCCFAFDNPFRRLVQNPYKILKPIIKPGWTIMDVGPGMGYFTIPLAVLTGDTGKVIAADLQPAMLEGVRKRAEKASVAGRIKLHQAMADKIGVTEAIDFCLAFWMVHEVLDRKRFIGEIVSALKPGGLFLFVEPKIHVTKASFDASIEIAKGLGLTIVAQPKIFISYAALFKK
jgi:ubiquinone/menaquinone biosynthesis C-methylase UbiE